jgi:hypothetical protein
MTPTPGEDPMSPRQEVELMDACRILFPTADINREFLCYIQAEGLKNAYRSRVWECHPDACGEDADLSGRTELFRRSVEAYNLLNDYLKERKPRLILRHSRPRKTAVFQVCKPALAQGEQYFQGPFPTIELRLGLYLYYSGVVSYQAVVRGLIWQRDQRPPLGDFARQWGWLSEADVSVILAATEIVGSFGERAVELGLLTQSQLNLILLHQRSMQQQIGRYFVEQGLVSELMLREHLRGMARHNAAVRKTRF